MKKLIFLISLLCSVYAFGQADPSDSTMFEIQGQATIADEDIAIIGRATDSLYFKITYAQLKTLLNALYLKAGDNATTLDGTAWRVFYVDGSGDVTELAIGSSGTYLKSQGASSVPTWDTPPGSVDGAYVTAAIDSHLIVVTGYGKIMMGNVSDGWYQATTRQTQDTLNILTGQTVAGSAGDIVVLTSANTWSQADADTLATSSGMLGINVSATAVLLKGFYTTTGLTVPGTYYLSTTAGGKTTTAPTTATDIVRIIGYSLSTTEFYFDPDKTYLVNN